MTRIGSFNKTIEKLASQQPRAKPSNPLSRRPLAARFSLLLIDHRCRSAVHGRVCCSSKSGHEADGAGARRKKIETLFGEVTRDRGLHRLRPRGPSGARDAFLLTATAQVKSMEETL
jgi:hypothetical protein